MLFLCVTGFGHTHDANCKLGELQDQCPEMLFLCVKGFGHTHAANCKLGEEQD
jgi:hypothetical protein